MLLSDLLGSRVHEPDGTSLGTVVDVRFRRGPARRSREGELELIALIVSPRSRMSYYGYERGRVSGPAVVAAIIRRMHRGTRIIPWECVASVEDGRVRLGIKAPVIPLDIRVPIEDG
ncbi:PRC-barrel domain containing protein [Microbacterium sp. 4R-513]|uniref:PRC-barrel domain containing protein n=1 Tax=Microbacterium sp. 4R-513 TaxID=2567934 RepID=UPI0019D0B64E|nr:PRC-barrel domain containing protein [Microbacterium sp. 4R-513]